MRSRPAGAAVASLTAALVVGLGSPALAAGNLDTSYGAGGVVTMAVAGVNLGRTVAAQTDGKDIVVASGTQSHLVVTRLTAAGALDTSYAGDGTANVVVGATTSPVGVIVDQAGRAVVLARCATSPSLCLIRLQPDGGLDQTFGHGGVALQQPAGAKQSLIEPKSLAEQVVDGHRYLVVAGPIGGAAGFGVERFNEDGSIDPTFGVAGLAATELPEFSGAAALAVDSQGRIVVSGYTTLDYGATFLPVLVRFLPTGELDPTFGAGGHVIDAAHPSGSSGQLGKDVVVDSLDRIDVLVDAPGATTEADDFAVERYLPNGQLDASFGSSGLALVDVGGMDYANALTLRTDGRLLLVGTTSAPGTLAGNKYALAQLLPDGQVDPSFGQNGVVSNGFNGFVSTYATAVAVQGNAAIVAGYPRIVARYSL